MTLAGQRFRGTVKGIQGNLTAPRLLGMAMEEVEDAVRPWSRAIDEVGPGHRTLWWYTGGQVTETTRRAQSGQVRQLAPRQQVLAQTRVHAIHADDDHLVTGRTR